jgi:hypothetical protein
MDDHEIIENMVSGMLKNVYTALPARITAVDPEKMKVKAIISRTEAGDKLETYWLPLRSLYAGENHGLCMIPYVDDECIVVFQDKNFNDAFVLPMCFNQENATPPTTPEGKLKIGDILLQHKTGTYVYINPEGFVEVFEKAGNKIRMTDGYIQTVTRDGQEVQTQNKCNVSDGSDKVLKQWTLLKTGSETLVLQDKRELGSVSDKSEKTGTVPSEEFTLDRHNTKESAVAMEEYLKRSSEIPYRDYHGMKYIQSDPITGGVNYQKIGMEVSGKANPKNLDVHEGKDPLQSFEHIIQNPFRQSMALFRAQITQDSVHLSCLITRQMGGKQVKTGFDAFIDDNEAVFTLNDIDYQYTMDPLGHRYNEELAHLKEELKEVFELRDYPVEK